MHGSRSNFWSSTNLCLSRWCAASSLTKLLGVCVSVRASAPRVWRYVIAKEGGCLSKCGYFVFALFLPILLHVCKHITNFVTGRYG